MPVSNLAATRYSAPRREPRLGRRPGNLPTRENILDAAEEAFAVGGYAGTTIREVAARAKVNQALVHHYFGTKDGLYNAIFLRRGHELCRERLRLLDTLEGRLQPCPNVEEIVRAFLVPAFDLMRGGPGGIAFLKIETQAQIEAHAIPRKLRMSVYDEPMTRFVHALQRAVPYADAAAIYWRMLFMVGAFLYAASQSSRLETLSQGLCNWKNFDETVAQLVPFLTAGLSAPSPSQQSTKRVSRQ